LSQQQVHQSHLVEHLSVFDAWRLSKMARPSPGSPGFHYLPQMITGQHHGFGMLYGLVQSQAAMLAFNDIYRAIAITLIPLIPLFLLLPSSKHSKSAPAH
jgi:hypothetical protein